MGERPTMNPDTDTPTGVLEARARQDVETLRTAALWAEEIRDNDPVHGKLPGVPEALTQMSDGLRVLAQQIGITRRPMAMTYANLRKHFAEEGDHPERNGGGAQLTVQCDGTAYSTTTDANGEIIDVQVIDVPEVTELDRRNLQATEAVLTRAVQNWTAIAHHNGGAWSDGSHTATMTMVGIFATLPTGLLSALLATAIGTIGRARNDTPDGSADAPA